MCPRDIHLLRTKLYFVFGEWCIGLSSARHPTPLGVPTDMLSVVKKVRPIKPGDLQSPYPIDMLATAWGLGIANPQSIKRLGHFLTADCKSAGTPNGGKDISGAGGRLTGDGHIRRYGIILRISHACTFILLIFTIFYCFYLPTKVQKIIEIRK